MKLYKSYGFRGAGTATTPEINPAGTLFADGLCAMNVLALRSPLSAASRNCSV